MIFYDSLDFAPLGTVLDATQASLTRMVTLARDIVCDMTVNEDDARKKGLVSQYKDKLFYFCGEACKREFEGHPEAFAGEKPVELYAGQQDQHDSVVDAPQA